MKKLISLLAFITILLFGCEKDYEIVTPESTKHTTSHNIGNDFLNLLIYKFNDGHKGFLNNSINVNDTFQYLKIVSYYSEDFRQRNIHEIEVYSNGVNIVLNQAIHEYEIEVKRNLSGQLTGVDLYQFIFDLRNNINDSTISIYAQTEGDVKEFMVDGNLISRWSSKRLNTYPSTLNYIGLDTVTVAFDLRKPFMVDSIKLYLGGWTQVFDLMVSVDNINWKYLEYTNSNTVSLDSVLGYRTQPGSGYLGYGYDVSLDTMIAHQPKDSTIIIEPQDSIINL